jgi:hypothetical protein
MVVADSARALCLVIISIKAEQKLLVKCEVEIDGGKVFRWIFSSIKSFKRRRKGEKKFSKCNKKPGSWHLQLDPKCFKTKTGLFSLSSRNNERKSGRNNPETKYLPKSN